MNPRYTRRRFLARSLEAAAALTLTCSSPPAGAAALKKLQIIDSHVHFYDPNRPQGVPWPPPDDKRLYRTLLPSNYRDQSVPQPIVGAVVVEASPWLEDNQWALDLAVNNPLIVGFVGNLPVGTKQFAGHLKRFASNKFFRGIRIRDRKLDGAMDDLAFVSDLKLLARYDLSLDLVGGQEILPFADRLAGEVPGLRIVIDHLAGVAIDGKAPATEWQKQMQALIPKPNVFFKLSGLVEGTGRGDGSAPRDVEFYRPTLDAMLRMFGSERLIYASNWPVSELFAPLATVQGIVTDYFSNQGRRAEEHIFFRSAKTAYRWVQRTHG